MSKQESSQSLGLTTEKEEKEKESEKKKKEKTEKFKIETDGAGGEFMGYRRSDEIIAGDEISMQEMRYLLQKVRYRGRR